MKNQVVLMKRKGINAAFIGEEQQDQQVISTIRAGHIPSGVSRTLCSAGHEEIFFDSLIIHKGCGYLITSSRLILTHCR